MIKIPPFLDRLAHFVGKKITLAYSFLLLTLFLYSYTQVDLNLTLLSWKPYLVIQKQFNQIGFFQRFWSTLIFSFLLLFLFLVYFLILWLAKNQKITEKKIWLLIILTLTVLLFSYPAFSYDIFNYIFDAKTVVVYDRDPHQVKPGDYSTDPMLRFMHWTHRPSIYPWGWIWLTIVPYWLGFGKFIFQLFSFKLMIAFFWLGTVWLIGKILTKTNPQKKLLGIVFYAFNPLVVIESLVSAHSDVVMLFFVMLAFWLFLTSQRKWLKFFFAVLSFVASIEIKYFTLVLSPVIFYILYKKIRVKKVDWSFVFKISLLLAFLGLLYIIHLRHLGLQPWYLLWLLPLAALLVDNLWVFWLTISFTFSSLLRYLPFLLTGNWGRLFKLASPWLTVLPPLFCFLVLLSSRSCPCLKESGKKNQ